MRSLLVPAYAKINLTLEVLRRLPSGYHEIASVMQELLLHDDVMLASSSDNEIRIVCNDPTLPIDERNLAWRAVERLSEVYSRRSGVTITLFKRIPIGGGMGGGSADAAAVLRGLNELWELHLDVQTLQTLARAIGMDVPFCVSGGSALATGCGDLLSPLSPAPVLDIVIAHPGIAVSTAEAYQRFNTPQEVRSAHADQMLNALSSNTPELIGECLYNDFETTVCQMVPAILQIKQTMLAHGAWGALMCGSGSGVFCIARSPANAQQIAEALQPIAPFFAVTQTRRVVDATHLRNAAMRGA